MVEEGGVLEGGVAGVGGVLEDGGVDGDDADCGAGGVSEDGGAFTPVLREGARAGAGLPFAPPPAPDGVPAPWAVRVPAPCAVPVAVCVNAPPPVRRFSEGCPACRPGDPSAIPSPRPAAARTTTPKAAATIGIRVRRALGLVRSSCREAGERREAAGGRPLALQRETSFRVPVSSLPSVSPVPSRYRRARSAALAIASRARGLGSRDGRARATGDVAPARPIGGAVLRAAGRLMPPCSIGPVPEWERPCRRRATRGRRGCVAHRLRTTPPSRCGSGRAHRCGRRAVPRRSPCCTTRLWGLPRCRP